MSTIKEEIRTETINGRTRKYKWYSTQVYIGTDKNGKRIYKRFSGRDKNEIMLMIAQAEEEEKSGVEKANRVTLGQALDEYIENRTAVCSPSTIRGYRALQRNALTELQQKDILEISQQDLQKAMNNYAEEHTPKSCRNVHGLFTSVLSIYRPEMQIRTKLPQKSKPTIYVPDQKEVREIYSMIKGKPLEIPFLLATQCGLRASEIAGLKTSRVYDDYIEITEACVRGDDGQVHRKAPKSVAGYRKVPISPTLAQKLRDNANGENVTQLTSAQISSNWAKLHESKRYHINPKLTFHALRHHFCSKCLLMNMPQKYIAELMGHSSNNMIEKVYAHIFPSAMEEFAQKLRADTDNLDI